MRTAPLSTFPTLALAAGSTLLLALSLSGCRTGPASSRADAAAPPPAKVVADVAEPRPTDVFHAPAPPAPPMAQAARAESERQRRQAMAQQMQAAPAIAFAPATPVAGIVGAANTERYEARQDNPVQRASEQPLSTFSIDVDTGSYANVRRMLREGVRPPADAVRVEEFLNYFSYGHPAPLNRDVPFRVTTELAPSPWNAKRQLLMVGIKGYDVPKAVLPPANLVFLVDTSGSMQSPDKLPLLKQAFAQLVSQLRAQDRVSIVVYAGSAGLVLPPTAGDRRGEILDALDRLEAGGSTNGGDGIRLAYAVARQGFVEGGVNRILLATDGDFNVGTVDRGTLETWVADQRKSGIALSTLGFGQGNYHDAMAERLADAGDGNHAYIDTPEEARKVLVEQMQSTLLTIANDVKIQIEFNPALVAEYRLVGYENRMLDREDFANDKVDAGDIGAGHEVTALYEVALVGSGGERLPPLRYGGTATPGGASSGEIAHLRLRYKTPGQAHSQLIETPVLRSSLRREPGEALRFASAVAGYADLLRGGGNVGDWNWDDVAAQARAASGDDRWGLRGEFSGLVESARRVTAATGTPVQAIAVE
ncbi:VWA domain-containing protein [Pseudoxanthomonas daejeonensis]|uniref:vWA domain-containing protein n=1 Tax=Pseudoxanthomonas daejeonensis TaxID=266062 RepID=UPI001F540D8A|nr:VWA domain-containing protein [Pseudoxanthomonas daejeonensis]UNK57794.1 VWA domain-containing protein [Pseudoxanthomonas daejeonensis]